MQYRVLCKSNRPGTLSRAPIQSPDAAQQGHKAPALRAREGQWALMTANTTNWPGVQALITALGLPNNPSKLTFIVIQEHRNAGPDECKQAEDWASNYGYNLSVAPAAITGRGKLQTSGGVAVGAQKRHNNRHGFPATLRKAQGTHPCSHLQLPLPTRGATGRSILEGRT